MFPLPDHRHWAGAGRDLVAKALAELAYEGLLVPEPRDDAYLVRGARDVYRFTARRGPFGAWRIDEASVETLGADGATRPTDDPLGFLLDVRHHLGIAGADFADVVTELTATHAAEARRRAGLPPATRLADMTYAELEAELPGHPCMVLNRGRLGFTSADAARYAPEARATFRLSWLALHPDVGRHHGVRRDEITARQLDAETRAAFGAVLADAGTESGEWAWMPVHPFHLDAALLPLLGPELADGRIIVLGEAPPAQRPLQGVRTVVDASRPDRFDTKLPLMIRNTLVWRGLAPQATAAAPAVSAWLQHIGRSDAFLRERCRMHVLGEVASVTARHPRLAAACDAPYRFQDMLGAVWREPISTVLGPGERARSLAALNAVGSDGRAVVAELVTRSGLDPEQWLTRMLDVLLTPLLHWLHRYGVAFCPHGENAIVLFDAADVPVGIAVKDLAEDVNLLSEALPEYASLPSDAAEVLLRWDAQELRHSILSAIFAGHFRFFGEVVERHLDVDEGRFWDLVAATLASYAAAFPDLADRIEAFDLRGAEFERVCLNREQLRGRAFHERAERDESFDVTAGTVLNPIADRPCV